MCVIHNPKGRLNNFWFADDVEVAIGQVHGTVNNVMLPTLLLLANLTKTPTNETRVSVFINGMPGPIRNWFKSIAIPLLGKSESLLAG